MLLQLTNTSLHLRPIRATDQERLCLIYASSREEEMAKMTHWSCAQKQAFLEWQFQAQHAYYQNNYTNAFFWVIVWKSKIIGRLYLHPFYENKSLRIIDITLLPSWRNKGIGRQILLDVMAFAAGYNRPVSIHVERFNPAMKFYKQLGFELTSVTNGIYHLLEWKTKQPLVQ